LATYLTEAHVKLSSVNNELNEQGNYHGKEITYQTSKLRAKKADQDKSTLNQLIQDCNPLDESSMSRTFDELLKVERVFEAKGKLLEEIFTKINFSDRKKYIEILASLENLDIHTKLRALAKCKTEWNASYISLASVYQRVGPQLVQIHSGDFISHDYFSGSLLHEVAELSGVPLTTLALELVY
jgi:hypothetical protein